MLKLFCGYDSREAIGYQVFCNSVIARSSVPVAFTPINSQGQKVGTNSFTVSRFLVPYLCGFQGFAVFADASDMICLTDIAEIAKEFNNMNTPVKVVKHDYKTKNPNKYIGTDMEAKNTDYWRKNWASLMVINCDHILWRKFTPDFVSKLEPIDLLQFKLFHPDDIHELPKEWNCLVDEGQDPTDAKILHWTAGVPAFEHYKLAKFADKWRKEMRSACYPART